MPRKSSTYVPPAARSARPPYRRATLSTRPPATASAIASTEMTIVNPVARRKSGTCPSDSDSRPRASTAVSPAEAIAFCRASHRCQRARMARSSPSPIIAARAPSTAVSSAGASGRTAIA